MQEFFQILPIWGLLLSIVFFIWVLGASASKMVDGAASLARYTGLSPLVIGATIISLGTTMPEMVISVLAAFYGDSGLALGNGVGSIIVDTALIMGLLVFLGRVVLEKRSISQSAWWRELSATALVLAAFFLPENILPRWFGFILLAFLVLYLLQTYLHQARVAQKIAKDKIAHTTNSSNANNQTGQDNFQENSFVPNKPAEDSGESPLGLGKSIIFLTFGLIFVVGSSRLLLPQVELFALRLGVSQDIIATTLVAFGTSLPELTTTLVAIRKKTEALGVGNIMGADILNALFVIGAAAATNPIKVEAAFFKIHFPVMLFVLWTLRLVFLTQSRKSYWSIPKWYGLFSILIYIGYILLQYLTGIEHI